MSYKAYPINAFSHAGSYPDMEKVVRKSTISWIKKHNQDSQLILYHYTNGDGLKGIIENRSIWCTYINALNDPYEFQYGKKLIEERIDFYIENEEDKNIIDALKEIRTFPAVVENTHKIFIASFCQNDNLLSQWRGYAERGVGYNLGFLFDSNTKYCYNKDEPDRELPINLRKVIYKKDVQIKIIDDYIIDLIGGLKQSSSVTSKFSMAPISILTSNLLIDMMLSMKNEKFVEENEWRLLRMILDNEVPKKSNFRLLYNEFIPYIETNIFNINNERKEFPLEFINIGPMLEKEKNKKVLKMFIDTETDSDHQIKLKEVHIDHAGYTLKK